MVGMAVILRDYEFFGFHAFSTHPEQFLIIRVSVQFNQCVTLHHLFKFTE